MLKSQFFLAALALGATTAMAQSLPELNGDPTNDTIAGGEVGACNTQHYGDISIAGDNDIWCFTIPADSRVTAWTTARNVTGTITDTIVEILDSTGSIIVSNDDEPGAPGFYSLASADLLASGNPYYVNVRGFSTRTGTYAVDILCDAPAGALPVAPGEAEPNDTCATGTPTNCNEAHENTLQVAGDSDFYCLSLASGDTVTFETMSSTATTGTEVGDTKIWLYDSACVEITNNDDGGAGLYSLISGQVLSAGIYYLEVSHWQRNGAGDYRLEVTCAGGAITSATNFTSMDLPNTPLCAGGFVEAPSESEPNDTCATGTPAGCCDSHRNTLQVAGDTDFYCLALGTPLTVTFETSDDTTTTGTSVGDTKIWLYDSNCVEITNNDDGGPGLYSRIAEDLSAGTYYLEVSHWQRNAAGDYRLTIDCEVSGAANCPGTSGFPVSFVERVGERPRINSTVTVDIDNTPPGTVVMLGTATTPIVDLGIIGAPGCRIATLVNFASLPITPTGATTGEFSIPLGFFPGLTFFGQAAAIDIGSNPLGVIISEERLEWTIGNEPY